MRAEYTREAGPPQRPQKREVARIRDGDVVLRQVMVPCGKSNCSKCPHGPYWYVAYWLHGRWREKYVGKSLTSEKAQKMQMVRDVLRSVDEAGGAVPGRV